MKTQDVSPIHELLNGFDKNLKFIVDLFESEVPLFMDLEMSPEGCECTGRIITLGYMSRFVP